MVINFGRRRLESKAIDYGSIAKVVLKLLLVLIIVTILGIWSDLPSSEEAPHPATTKGNPSFRLGHPSGGRQIGLTKSGTIRFYQSSNKRPWKTWSWQRVLPVKVILFSSLNSAISLSPLNVLWNGWIICFSTLILTTGSAQISVFSSLLQSGSDESFHSPNLTWSLQPQHDWLPGLGLVYNKN